MSTDGKLVLLAGGDVAPIVQPVDRLADLIQPVLDTADFRFVQCERTYSNRGSFPDWMTVPKGGWSRLPPEYASIFKAARADVVSVASNHTLDWGWEPLEDTIAMFKEWGVQTAGGGATEEEAHKPVIIEKDGVKVAILAYCSVLREGQTAIGTHPGIAGIRARTWYEPVDFQPGCPPNIMSEALEEDVKRLEHDIREAKKLADAVVLSIHWGLRWIPKVLATYQTPVAHAAIDAGADLIIGHHPHQIKAVEVYKGKVCFYSIGNYLTTGDSKGNVSHPAWNIFWYERDPNSAYAFPIQCKENMMPRITFNKNGIERVAVLPGFINDQAQPRALTADDPLFEQVHKKIEWASDQYPSEFVVEGDEIVVKTS